MKTGKILMMANGECDEYRPDGLLRVIKDFDFSTVGKRYLDEATYLTGENPRRRVKKNGALCFKKWLCEKGYTETIWYSIIHAGYYSEIDFTER